jgi:hypothetical protein
LRVPTAKRIGQVLLVGTLVAAAVVLLDAFLFADATDLSALRRGVMVGLAVGFIALVTNAVPVPPAVLIGFGLLALAVYGTGLVLAPPVGWEWLAFVVIVAFPVGLIWWGVAMLRARRTAVRAGNPDGAGGR